MSLKSTNYEKHQVAQMKVGKSAEMREQDMTRAMPGASVTKRQGAMHAIKEAGRAYLNSSGQVAGNQGQLKTRFSISIFINFRLLLVF